jgi:fructose-1,6-bisphosphatase/sedoheptulose 1,7-bisphosphatase-like protein
MHPGAIIGAFLAGVFGVAIVALLVSSKSVTKDVLSSGGTALAGIINAATLQGVGGNGTGALTVNPGSGSQVTNPTASPV